MILLHCGKMRRPLLSLKHAMYGDGNGFGSHALNTVVDIKAGDKICVTTRGRGDRGSVTVGGHLAMLVLE